MTASKVSRSSNVKEVRPKLPEGFDLTVVNLEFKVEKEKDLTSEVIHELITLYT